MQTSKEWWKSDTEESKEGYKDTSGITESKEK
jgi:hypothetical protein